MRLHRLIRSFALAACAGLVFAAGAQAQTAANYPDHPVRMIVAFPPGGATDIIARVVAEKLQTTWGKPVVVENISGATGMTGTAQGLKADPDGYTITSVVGTTTSLLAAVRSKVPYSMDDLAPLALAATFPNMLVVRPGLGVKTIPELIDLLKKNPGKYSYATSGYGSSIHLAAEWFKLLTKTDMLHVPFTGSSPAGPAMLGGHVDMMFDVMPSVLPLVQSHQLVALGVGTPTRVESVPDVPAIAEFLPGFDVASWEGFVVPAKTPADIRKKISDAILEGLKDPQVIERIKNVGGILNVKGPDDFKTFMAADHAKWVRVSKDTGIKID